MRKVNCHHAAPSRQLTQSKAEQDWASVRYTSTSMSEGHRDVRVMREGGIMEIIAKSKQLTLPLLLEPRIDHLE